MFNHAFHQLLLNQEIVIVSDVNLNVQEYILDIKASNMLIVYKN